MANQTDTDRDAEQSQSGTGERGFSEDFKNEGRDRQGQRREGRDAQQGEKADTDEARAPQTNRSTGNR